MNARQPHTSASPRAHRQRRAARAYQAAFEAVLSIPIAGGLGYWADASWGSAPWGLLLGLGFGFAAFVQRLLRMRRFDAQGDAPAAPTAPPTDARDVQVARNTTVTPPLETCGVRAARDDTTVTPTPDARDGRGRS